MAAPRNSLPFQYELRGQQLQYLDGDAESHAIERRDSELEDYLGVLEKRVATLEARLATAGIP